MIDYSAAASAAGAIVAALIDARTGYIPNAVTRTTSFAALITASAAGSAVHACAGALSVGGSLAVLYLLTRGRGLGLGDVKLGTAIGSGLGTATGTAALGAAFVIGGAYATWLLATGRARRGDPIRFGPFLACGTVIGIVVLGNGS